MGVSIAGDPAGLTLNLGTLSEEYSDRILGGRSGFLSLSFDLKIDFLRISRHEQNPRAVAARFQ
jgi:hypothetical protein